MFPDSARIYSAAVILMLIAPLAVSGPVPGLNSQLSITWPMIHSGDEPHYLIMINSIINDRDLDVANNYANVHTGIRHDAGRKFDRWPLDHHVTWYRGNRFIHWIEAYETDFQRWNRDSDGNPTPTLRQGFDPALTNRTEFCQHSPGIAFLLSPFLFPLRGTSFVECAALLATSIVTAVGFLVFCIFVRPYVAHAYEAVFIGAIAYLGSPLWHYGRTLFVEPYAATFAICACYAALRGSRYWLAGFLLSTVYLLKSPFAIMTIPIVAEAAWRGEWRNVFRASVPLAVAVGITLRWNKLMWDGWLHLPQRWETGSLLDGTIGLLFSVRCGILLVSPVLVVSACCIPQWFAHHRRDAIVVSSTILGYFLQTACYALWHGGYCYSARYLVPIIPLMFVPLAVLPKLDVWRRDRRVELAIGLSILISINFGVIAAFGCENVWGKHPLQLLLPE